VRYEVRARDSHGDFGVLVHTYWLRWFAERRLARCQAQLRGMRDLMGWYGEWEYYIREVP
jgi:hypothetical protein